MATLQRLGRVNRWGEFDLTQINIFNLKNSSETQIKSKLFNTKLLEKWFAFLTKYDGKILDLSEFYHLYNSFFKENKEEIERYISDCYSNSFRLFTDVFPIQSDKKEDENLDIKKYKSNSNKIRANGNQIFCIYKIKNSDKFTEPFNVTVTGGDFKEKFKEEEDTTHKNKILRTLKKFLREDERYDYSQVNFKKFYMNNFRELSVYSNTPYISFDKEYDVKYGLMYVNFNLMKF